MLSSHNLNFFLAILLQLLINYKGYDFPSIFKKMIITAFLKVHVNVLLKRNNFNSKKDKILLFIRNPLYVSFRSSCLWCWHSFTNSFLILWRRWYNTYNLWILIIHVTGVEIFEFWQVHLFAIKTKKQNIYIVQVVKNIWNNKL